MADESTDSATMEQLGVYVRYVDVDKGKLCEDFLEMKRIDGHPTAQNIFDSLMEVLNPENPDLRLPLNRLAGLKSDGASVMISPKNGVLGKLRGVAEVSFLSFVLTSFQASAEIYNEFNRSTSNRNSRDLSEFLKKTKLDVPADGEGKEVGIDMCIITSYLYIN